MRELTSEELVQYNELQPRINDRLMTEQEFANWLDNSYRNPRIQEIEDRKQEILIRFDEIDLQRKHWSDKVTENNVLICDDSQWEVYRLEKQTLLDEWHLLKQELIELNV